MDHSAYIREAAGSRVAVVMIHGIAGTPAHFRDLLPLIPQSWSVYNILLDGHGKEVEDFGASSMKKWQTQVTALLEDVFSRYERVVLMGHSMGTLFSIQAAVAHPERVAFLFLLNVPTRPRVKLSTVHTCLRVARGNIRPDDAAAQAMRGDTSIHIVPQLWKYLCWTPRMAELLTLIRRTRRCLPKLRVPCYTFQSQADELVAVSSCADLENHPHIRNTLLTSSGHFCYSREDTCLLQARLQALLTQLQTAFPS